MKVIVIEDDQYIIDDIKFYLTDKGLESKIFSNPDDVMNNLKLISNYSHVILDIMLKRGTYFVNEKPELETGEILFQKIKDKYPQIKFIIVSAKQFVDIKTDFSRENNVLMVINKPLDEQIINKIIEKIKVG